MKHTILVLSFLLGAPDLGVGASFQKPCISSNIRPLSKHWLASPTVDTVDHEKPGHVSSRVDDSFVRESFEQQSSSISEDVLSSRNAYARVFPFSQIVNHESIKQALLLAATNPQLGRAGVLIGGGHGTCKSVLARSAIHLFPQEMERLLGNPFNIEPIAEQVAQGHPLELDSFLWNQDRHKDTVLEAEHITMPFVTVPLHVMEDSLLGSVDIEKSMETGRTAFSPGLLAKAHRGILYVDDIHLLEDSVVNCLMNVLSDGYVRVEREGLSCRYPCRPALVLATYNPEEGDLREHLMDRFAMTVLSDGRPLTVEERVQVVENVESFHSGSTLILDQGLDALPLKDGASSITKDQEDLRENVVEARELLPHVQIETDQILYLCEEADRAGCEGQRAELMATEIAKTAAALQGRERVNAQDLQYGVFRAIAPRATVPFRIGMDQEDELEDEAMPPPPQQQSQELQPLEPEPDLMPPAENELEEEDTPQSENIEGIDEHEDDNIKEEEEEEEETEELMIPNEFLFGVDYDIPIDPCVLQFSKKLTRKGKGGKHAKIFSTSRGRFVKAIFPKAGHLVGRLAIGATLRAAAPHQKARHHRQLQRQQTSEQHSANDHRRGRKEPKVRVTKDDFRIQRLSRKAGTLVVFVVDASGSMALNRMGAAKGAAMILLQEAYKCRDKIALIEFHGSQAQVLVPPTKSLSMTKNRLESLPCGGGSPLAHALETAVRVALNELKVKRDVGRVVLVLLTDGRANVPLSVSMGEADDTNSQLVNGISSDRKLLRKEVVALAKQVSAISDLDFLCIDTEDQFVGTGIARDITEAALGSYTHLVGTAADTRAVSQLVRKGMQEARS